jgi:L-asparagine transporter-like permease
MVAIMAAVIVVGIIMVGQLQGQRRWAFGVVLQWPGRGVSPRQLCGVVLFLFPLLFSFNTRRSK